MSDTRNRYAHFFPHRQSKFNGEFHNGYVYTGVFGEPDYCGNAVPGASRADQRLYAERKKIVPVLENTESKALIEHGLYEYERGILAFSRQMCETSKISGKQIASMKNVLLYLRHIGQEPSEDVLEFLPLCQAVNREEKKGG